MSETISRAREKTQLYSTLDYWRGFTCASTTKSEPLQVENYKHSVVCSEFYHENPYIEVEGSFHWLNWVSLEFMDDRVAIHVACRPLLSISTDFRTWDTLVNWLRSVAIKSQSKLPQSVASQHLCPFDLWFDPMWSVCHKHSCRDTIFVGIPNILVISGNAPIWNLCS
jgi:hypothetical protein